MRDERTGQAAPRFVVILHEQRDGEALSGLNVAVGIQLPTDDHHGLCAGAGRPLGRLDGR